jgi:hypothetical protein
VHVPIPGFAGRLEGEEEHGCPKVTEVDVTGLGVLPFGEGEDFDLADRKDLDSRGRRNTDQRAVKVDKR